VVTFVINWHDSQSRPEELDIDPIPVVRLYKGKMGKCSVAMIVEDFAE
jgi:hypothetical protein